MFNIYSVISYQSFALSAVSSAPRQASDDDKATYDKIVRSIGHPRMRQILQFIQLAIPFRLDDNIVGLSRAIGVRDAEDLSSILTREMTRVTYRHIV